MTKQMLYPSGPDSANDAIAGGGFFGMVKGAATENAAGEAIPIVAAQGQATDAFGNGTREHNVEALMRQAVGAASARVALPTLGASREIYVMSNQRCFFRTGNNSVAAAAGTSHPLAADERFYLRVPNGHTHIAYIRDAVDGNITICAVA